MLKDPQFSILTEANVVWFVMRWVECSVNIIGFKGCSWVKRKEKEKRDNNAASCTRCSLPRLLLLLFAVSQPTSLQMLHTLVTMNTVVSIFERLAVRSAVHLCCAIKFVKHIIQWSLHIIQSTLIFQDLGNPQPFVKKLYFTYKYLPSNGLLDWIHFWLSFTDQLSCSLLKFDKKGIMMLSQSTSMDAVEKRSRHQGRGWDTGTFAEGLSEMRRVWE